MHTPVINKRINIFINIIKININHHITLWRRAYFLAQVDRFVFLSTQAKPSHLLELRSQKRHTVVARVPTNMEWCLLFPGQFSASRYFTTVHRCVEIRHGWCVWQ